VTRLDPLAGQRLNVAEPVEVLLRDYSRYLTERRGLSLSTAEVYIRLVRPVVATR